MSRSLEEAAHIALACMDLTSLGEADTPLIVADLISRSHGGAGAPAALCVWPRFVRQVVAGLQVGQPASGRPAQAGAPARVQPRVAAVANFPSGAQPLSQVLSQVRGILADGGDEVDLVLDWQALRRGGPADLEAATAGVRAVRRACRSATLKLIIESGELKEPALIAQASRIGLNEGVDFLKTSTGKTPLGATPEAARVMLEAIAAHPRGAAVGFKASGGVRTVADAQVYIDLVGQILGEQALAPARFRIGASGLLADVQAVLGAGMGAASAGRESY
jgi:deoxyribose-phosphate aldolase